MRIRVLSDIHFEFHADGGREFVRSLDPMGADCLVVAGDLAVGEGVGPALDLLCHRFSAVPVVYVHGNHEFYRAEREAVRRVARDAALRHENLHWLDAEAVEIGGRRFVGAPLWFRQSVESARFRKAMTDFAVIPDFERWVYADNARALEFLDRELRRGDVVVTHHLPAESSIVDRFKGNPLNAYFLCDVEDLIRERTPALWIHGHTHASLDYRIGATRVVCNPFGYATFELNPKFDPGFTVEV